MNISENERHQTIQSEVPAKEPSADRHGEKTQVNKSTPNGYNSISNHTSKHDGSVKKSHDSVKHSESSDHIKKKEHSKHSSSSHSKPKDSPQKLNDVSKSKEHSKHDRDKEKKHSSKHSEHPKHPSSEHSKHPSSEHSKHPSSEHSKHPSSEHSKHPSSEHSKHSKHSEHSKHSSSLKNGTDKGKSDDKSKKDHKSSESKPKSEHSSDHKLKKDHDIKDKKLKKPEDSHKDKHHEKSKSDKPKDKHDDKLKEKKHVDKPKDKSHDVKVKIEKMDSSPDKKKSPEKDHHKKPSSQTSSPVKKEPVTPIKYKQEDLSDDDMPLSSRAKPKAAEMKRAKKALSDDDEPISNRISKTKKATKRKPVDSDYEEDDDEDYKKPAKKKVKKEVKGATKAKRGNLGEGTTPRKKTKKEDEQEVWKWWEEEKQEDGVKWKTLQHWGPVFAPLYERVPKNVKFYYDGKHMELSEETEEVAGFYGRMLDHDYTTKDVFNTNFFKDWRKVMTSKEKESIRDLKKCNFKAYDVYYKLKSEERKAMTKEEKLVLKQQNEELTQKYGFCIIDGHKQKIGNFKIEPPGLFRGRGEHPKMGMLKRRVQPEDISINIGEKAEIPEPPKGHKWKKVLHDNTVTWLASWNENILNSTKYIMLNPSSKLKGEKDWQKYEMARKLKNHVDRIRKTYSDDFRSKEMKVRQRAVALYFIDKLALRAGNEKDEDTADTVGCCSLRVEHITLHEELNGQEYVVNFDFLGKDSIRYENSVPVEKRAYKNVKLFMENKQPGDDLFDRLNTGILNKYLTELMDGLTAKVFRTYNASNTLQQQLDLLTKEEMSVPEKMLAYNRANRAVAVLCNHQRAIPKTFDKSMDNLKTKIDEKMAQIKEVKRELKQAKSDAKSSGSVKDKQMVDKKKKRLETLNDQLEKLQVQATDKEENKQIALGTSKLNYLDPRISVAWCKKWDVPVEKIYNKTQRDKFRWAIEMAGPEFEF